MNVATSVPGSAACRPYFHVFGSSRTLSGGRARSNASAIDGEKQNIICRPLRVCPLVNDGYRHWTRRLRKFYASQLLHPKQMRLVHKHHGETTGGAIGPVGESRCRSRKHRDQELTNSEPGSGCLEAEGMDVAGFLDALCWGNQLAIADPTTRSARTNLMQSDRLVMVVSRWLCPPRTSQGGSRAGGAKRALLPLVVDTVKKIINEEMDAVWNN